MGYHILSGAIMEIKKSVGGVMESNKKVRLSAITVLVGLACQGVSAVEVGGVEFNGYTRVGAAQNSKSGALSCFQLDGARTKYRLGNECENYGEFLFSKDAWKSDDGAKFKANFMAAYTTPPGDTSGGSFAAVQQMYVEGRDIPELMGAKIWGGKRFYKRRIVYINDFGYNAPSGTGAGIEDLPAFGESKFSYAFFRHNDTAATPSERVGASRHDFQLTNIPLGSGATLDGGLSVIKADGSDVAGHFENGRNVFLEYKQALGEFGANTLFVERGTGTGVHGNYSGIGGQTTTSDVKRTTLLDYVNFTVNRSLSGQVLALVESTDNPAGDQKWYSVGGRLVYAFTNHFRLNGEIGHDRVKPEGQDARSLTKFTIAPAIALDGGFWSRPELRLYYTYAKWNEAAQTAAAAGTALSSTGVFGTSTNGSNFGVQVEAWW